jgi:hypothetical protein
MNSYSIRYSWWVLNAYIRGPGQHVNTVDELVIHYMLYGVPAHWLSEHIYNLADNRRPVQRREA